MGEFSETAGIVLGAPEIAAGVKLISVVEATIAEDVTNQPSSSVACECHDSMFDGLRRLRQEGPRRRPNQAPNLFSWFFCCSPESLVPPGNGIKIYKTQPPRRRNIAWGSYAANHRRRR